MLFSFTFQQTKLDVSLQYYNINILEWFSLFQTILSGIQTMSKSKVDWHDGTKKTDAFHQWKVRGHEWSDEWKWAKCKVTLWNDMTND